MEVPPFSTALAAYSTWKFLPSGENTLFDKSYPVPTEVYGGELVGDLGKQYQCTN